MICLQPAGQLQRWWSETLLTVEGEKTRDTGLKLQLGRLRLDMGKCPSPEGGRCFAGTSHPGRREVFILGAFQVSADLVLDVVPLWAGGRSGDLWKVLHPARQ